VIGQRGSHVGPAEPSVPDSGDEPVVVLVFEAERAGGAAGLRGVVWRGGLLDEGAAVARIRSGEDVVVSASTPEASRDEARRLTVLAFGDSVRDRFHGGGRHAMPHFHQKSRASPAHVFYEMPPARVARRRP
ncbi:MAG: hypothetical protein ACRC33_30740, partial [Gemmataceae bacterium]